MFPLQYIDFLRSPTDDVRNTERNWTWPSSAWNGHQQDPGRHKGEHVVTNIDNRMLYDIIKLGFSVLLGLLVLWSWDPNQILWSLYYLARDTPWPVGRPWGMDVALRSPTLTSSTQRYTDSQTHIDTQMLKHTQIQILKQIDTQTHRDSDTETQRHTNAQLQITRNTETRAQILTD